MTKQNQIYYAFIDDLNVLTLFKGDQCYQFLYDDMSAPEMLRIFARQATNKELSLDLTDAAALGQRLRDFSPAPIEDMSIEEILYRRGLPDPSSL